MAHEIDKKSGSDDGHETFGKHDDVILVWKYLKCIEI